MNRLLMIKLVLAVFGAVLALTRWFAEAIEGGIEESS